MRIKNREGLILIGEFDGGNQYEQICSSSFSVHMLQIFYLYIFSQAAAQATACGFENVKPEPRAPGSPAGAS